MSLYFLRKVYGGVVCDDGLEPAMVAAAAGVEACDTTQRVADSVDRQH